MENHLNIVNLIENNPITKLSGNYQSKLLNKIREKFNTHDQQLFVASFYCYLNVSKDDYVIELDNIWKWMGFSQKVNAKKLLMKHFTKNVDYKVLLCQEQKRSGPGGQNKENILLKIDVFKMMCILSQTEKGKNIREYFVHLEDLLHELLDEESTELRQQLEDTENKLETTMVELKNSENNRNWLMNRRYYEAKAGDVVYLYKDCDKLDDSLYKIGKSKGLSDRELCYSNFSKTGRMVLVKYCLNCDLTEKVLHHILDKYRVIRNREWFDFPSEEFAIQTIFATVNFMDSHMDTIEDFIPDMINYMDIDIYSDIDNIPVQEQNDVEEFADRKNPKDFDKFIDECCELSETFTQTKADLKSAHRVWSKCTENNVISALDMYLKNRFKVATIIEDDIKRNVYKGVRLMPLVFVPKNEVLLDYETFIMERCKTDYQYRISFVDFFNAFSAWKCESFPKYKLSGKYKKEIQNYLEIDFAGGRVHLSGGARATHLFGVWGLGMGFNNFGLKVKERTCKEVGQFDIDDHLLKKWDSLSIASRENGIALSTLSNYCRFNNVVNGLVYKYI